MKIAVFHNLPSGGAKRSLYNFVKYLMKLGHIVDVFVPSTADEHFLPLKEVSNKFQVFQVKRTITGLIKSTIRYGPSLRHLADLERTQRHIANVINRTDYDVVYIEQDRYVMSPFLLKYIKKPSIYYCPQPLRTSEVILQRLSQKVRKVRRGSVFRKLIREYFLRKIAEIDRYNASFANYILTNSYFSREAILRAYGLNSFVCYLGVDTETFKPLNCIKENYVLSVGACDPAKGHDFIIRSLGLINQKIRPKLIMVCDRVDDLWMKYLKRLASRFNVNLEIRSRITDDELVLLYNKAKLVVYAPYLEPFGLVPLEAMACGVPVVAIKEGGIRESVIHGETGILTERDEQMFAEAIEELLLDDSKRVQMGKRGIDVVKNFWTAEHAVKRLLWHLERAINLYT